MKEILPGITELPRNMAAGMIGSQCCQIMDHDTGTMSAKIPLLGDRPRQVEAVMFAIGKLLEVRALRASRLAPQSLPEPVKKTRHLRLCTDQDSEPRV